MPLWARRAMLAFLVFLACGGVGATFAAFTDTTSTPSTFSSSPTFLEFVQDVGSAKCGGTSDSVTVPAGGVAAGNTLIVRVGLYDRNPMGSPSVTDSQGNSYQMDVNQTSTNSHTFREVVFSAYVATALAAGDTITVSHPTVDSPSMAVTEFRGIEQVASVDQTGSNAGIGGSPTASLTTNQNYDLVIGSAVSEDNSTVSQPGGGWNALPSVFPDCGVPQPHTQSSLYGAYRIEASTGTFTYDPTVSGFPEWVDVLVAYKG